MNDQIVISGISKLLDIWASNLMSIADEVRSIDQSSPSKKTEFASKLIKAQILSSFMDEKIHITIHEVYPEGINVEEHIKIGLLVNADIYRRIQEIQLAASELFGEHHD